MTKKKRKIQKNFLCVLLFFTFSAPPARLLLNLSLLLTLSVSLFSCSFPQFSFFFFFFFFFFFCKSFTRADIHTQHTEGYIYIYTYIYMARKGIHPLLRRVQYVGTQGQTYQLWSTVKHHQDRYFLSQDQYTHPAWTGIAPKSAATGQAAKFKRRGFDFLSGLKKVGTTTTSSGSAQQQAKKKQAKK